MEQRIMVVAPSAFTGAFDVWRDWRCFPDDYCWNQGAVSRWIGLPSWTVNPFMPKSTQANYSWVYHHSADCNRISIRLG